MGAPISWVAWLLSDAHSIVGPVARIWLRAVLWSADPDRLVTRGGVVPVSVGLVLLVALAGVAWSTGAVRPRRRCRRAGIEPPAKDTAP